MRIRDFSLFKHQLRWSVTLPWRRSFGTPKENLVAPMRVCGHRKFALIYLAYPPLLHYIQI